VELDEKVLLLAASYLAERADHRAQRRNVLRFDSIHTCISQPVMVAFRLG
jgi:hypothetical protein